MKDNVVSFYNTTRERGKKLAECEGKAVSQQDRIYEYFYNTPHAELSPSQVQQALAMQRTPLTSIRRAMTNLTLQGRLQKTELKVMGLYGRYEYCWRYRGKGSQLDLL